MEALTGRGFCRIQLVFAACLLAASVAASIAAREQSAPASGQAPRTAAQGAAPAAAPMQPAPPTPPQTNGASAISQTAPAPLRQLRKLKLGKQVERELKGGETDVYTAKVKKGQFVLVIAEQKGIDIVLSIISPDGKNLSAADSPNGAWGPETASVIAAQTGEFQFQVASGDRNVLPGKYEIRLAARHKPDANARMRLEAEHLFYEAAQLSAQPEADNQRKALSEYETVLPQWRQIGDQYKEGLTLAAIGELRGGLGEYDRALEAGSQALEIWRMEKNDRARASTLITMGKIHELQNQWKQAVDCYNEGLKAARAAGDRFSEAILLNQLGLAYDNRGEHQKAIEAFNQALALDRAIGNRREELVVLSNTAVSYAQEGEKQKAIDLCLETLKLARERQNKPAEAHMLAALGVLYTGRGEAEKGIQSFQESLTVFRALGDRSGEGAALTNLGSTYDVLGDRKTAIQYFEQALPIARAAGDRYWEAVTLTQMGSAYNNLGERSKALEYYTQALTVSRAMGDRKEESVCLSNIGAVYKFSGEPERALSFFVQSLDIDRAMGDRQGEATSLGNLGSVHDELGDKQKALEDYTQALDIAKAVEDRDGEATWLNDIGRVYADLGQKQKALEYFQKSLEIERTLHNASKEAAALQNVAATLSSAGEPEQALRYFEEGLALAEKGGDRPTESGILHSLGKFYEERGELEKALSFYKRSLPLERAVQKRSGEAGTLNNIAEIDSHLGRKDEALKNYSQALAIAHSVKDPLVEAAILSNLMNYWKDGENPTLATFFGKQAVNAYQLVRGKIQGLDKDSQKSFVESKSGTYRQLAEILIVQGRLSEAEQVLDLLKNEEYFEFIRRSGADAASLTGSVDLTAPEKKEDARYRELGEEIAGLGVERGALEAKKTRTPEEETRFVELTKAVEVADHEFGVFLDDLYKELGSSEQASGTTIKVQEEVSTLQNVLRALPAGTVGLYTFVGDERYHVIVVTREVSIERRYDIKREELRDKVEQLREALRSPRSNPVPLAQELYKILLAPVEKDLVAARAKTVMLSLDDVLRYVPFAALHDSHQYVVEKYRTEVFTTASLLNLTEKPQIASWSGLGMGVSKPLGGMPALPTVPEELHQVIHDAQDAASAGVVPGRVMLDEAFTEDGMKSELKKNYPLVHIASHFVSAPGSYRDSYLLLGEAEGKHLTLAEIHDSPEIKFNDTELLTLSACNTATGGKSNGREIDGLGMMAQRKGAKAVVASLWDVYDSSTGVLMADFYRRWIDMPGMTKGEALRLAQLDLLRGTAAFASGSSQGSIKQNVKTPVGTVNASASAANPASRPIYSHPFYWAPFILIGNWQ